jgi:hypothetical protein
MTNEIKTSLEGKKVGVELIQRDWFRPSQNSRNCRVIIIVQTCKDVFDEFIIINAASCDRHLITELSHFCEVLDHCHVALFSGAEYDAGVDDPRSHDENMPSISLHAAAAVGCAVT